MKRNKRTAKQHRSNAAQPVVSDMLGCNIKYVYARPHMRNVIVETGEITQLKQHKNVLYMLIKPHNPARVEKWIPETDFIAYVRIVQIEKAIA